MTKICPSCGTAAVDDQAKFCNKCGYPFPKQRPDNRTIVSRAEGRIYEAEASADEAPAGVSRPVRSPQPAPQKTGAMSRLPFKRCIGRNFIRPVYILGVIGILLIAVLGIMTDFSTSGTSTDKVTGLVSTSIKDVTTLPLFWICFLIFGNLFWRVICETCAVQFAIYDSLTPVNSSRSRESGDVSGDGGTPAPGEQEYYECPRCGKVVPADQLRECGHCGVQGCSNCIRVTGLVKKTALCKDCFEGK
ncbi:DUF4282 domain-containing protein [Methanoregula sp.]|uniref:DUF4282 domain-containing protein n=1 Tax=Methanoregula sp. TaxID=2052170 RepID=UPI0023717455|nr:DUF4282 domain-containing protein [Methanoregula sp.]MDD1686136.1 DUF4282 domain-containing protein [Methanoregula sp.]